jgi:hypothetical protein
VYEYNEICGAATAKCSLSHISLYKQSQGELFLARVATMKS